MSKKQFVLSSTPFTSIKHAEKKINGWYQGGKLKNNNVKLFKVTETYDLKLKFVKRKK